jgi:predicted N-acetyltransferase YhbS
MRSMLIRHMTPADAEAVSALIDRGYDQVLAHYHSPELIRRFREHTTPESLREQLSRKDVYVVEDGGRIVATGGVGQWDDEKGGPDRRVTNLFVAVDLIGRGIGRMLLDHLETLACGEGATSLHALSSRSAVSFYQRAGFLLDDPQPATAGEITWMTKPL